MREIKFRGWHLTEKRIIDVRNINFWDDMVGYDCQGEWQYFDACGLSDVAIMQYTGLKDKNDREIYEGDVCQGVMNSTKYQGFVRFENATFYLYCEKSYFIRLCYLEDKEVLGNIYENPELLEIKK